MRMNHPALNNYFQATQAQLANERLSWLKKIKDEKWTEFSAQGFPTRADENWKYTDLSELAQQPFKVNPSISTSGFFESFKEWCLPNAMTWVFINGHYHKELSVAPEKAQDVIFADFNTALLEYTDLIKPFLEKEKSSAVMNNLNLALMNKGFFLYVPASTCVKQTLQFLFLSTCENADAMQQLRNVIVLGESSEATFVETWASNTRDKYFNHSVTQMALQKNARGNYYKMQKESESAFHIATLQAELAHQAYLKTAYYSLGGQLAREDLQINLQGQGASCQLYGLYLANEKQHHDHHTRIDHLSPHTSSAEDYKGIIADKATAVFNGKVVVHHGADQSSAMQSNKNLLLNPGAQVNTKPELEIYADDIQCKHGATVGEIDNQLLFYLRSRGLDKNIAYNLLLHAFAAEMIEIAKELDIKNYINTVLERKISGLQK